MILQQFYFLGKKTVQDIDGNDIEYVGELDTDDQACGKGESTCIHKQGLVSYKGMWFNNKPEGRGKDHHS